MRKIVLTALALCTCVYGDAYAQQRTPNAGHRAMLRTWPQTGAWEVGLARFHDGGFGCLAMTGYRNPNTEERYIWGVAQEGSQTGWRS